MPFVFCLQCNNILFYAFLMSIEELRNLYIYYPVLHVQEKMA